MAAPTQPAASDGRARQVAEKGVSLVFLGATLALAFAVAYTGLTQLITPEWSVLRKLEFMTTIFVLPPPFESRVLGAVLQHAKQDDPKSVIKAIDDYCWRNPTMNIGDVKGAILDKSVSDRSPLVALEFGAYMGYSAVRIGRLLKRGAVLYSVDPSPQAYAISQAVVAKAGLQSKVSLVYNTSTAYLHSVKDSKMTFDLVLLDHWKDLYRSDVELLLKYKLIKKGSVIVADNVVCPGAPEYRKWMLKREDFETEIHNTKLEYTKHTRDEVLVSTYLG